MEHLEGSVLIKGAYGPDNPGDDVLMMVAAGIAADHLPALMGVPGVCVALEPKLANVHNMLPHGTLPWRPPFDQDALKDLVGQALRRRGELRRGLAEDVKKNQALAREAKSELDDYLDRVF